jgi:hypothetical protein
MGGHIGRGRSEDHRTYTVERNLIYWESGPLLSENKAWEKGAYAFDRNLYWNPNTNCVMFHTWTFAEWQARGKDVHSLLADPLFTDPARGDFTLKPGSPAEKIGFVPFDWRKAGRLTHADAPHVLAPRAFPPAPKTPPDFPPEAIAEDFESLHVGDKCLFGSTQEDPVVGRARVTDETAAGGKHSLKFADAAGQKAFYNPHVTYKVGFKHGLAHVGFDLRWEAGAHFACEWRDYHVQGHEFANGPALQVGEDGALTSGGKRLAVLPAGQWVHIDVYCALGGTANGVYDIALRTPDGRIENFTGLSFTSPFKQFDWCGLLALKNGDGVFYLDNLLIEPNAKR